MRDESRCAAVWDGLAQSALPEVTARLEAIFADTPRAGPGLVRLWEAMRYAVLGGGKRLRPLTVMASASAFGAELRQGLQAGCALELIHCYSLVHDDLPDMDNDTLRRGRPTVHMAFDPAYAILAGDALLTMAFELLAAEPRAGALVREMATAAGAVGMVGGQALDRALEHQTPAPEDILDMYARKTGGLIASACAMGAVIAGAPEAQVATAREFGLVVGQLFQIADDLIGAHGDPRHTGKPVGRDAECQKATLLAILGEGGARQHAEELHANALLLLDQIEQRGGAVEVLAGMASFAWQRRH